MQAFPPETSDPFGFYPLALRPTASAIVQNVFPGTPGQASTPAQITQALIVAGTGIARVDVFVSAGQMATINSAPVLAVPGIPGSILVPVLWSYSKTTNAIGALAATLSLQYADASFNGFTSMTTIAGDQNNVRAGCDLGVGSVGLQVLSFAARNPTGLGLQIIGSADPGNFPASQTPARFSILFTAWVP